jgi:hypothetical protein
LGYADRVTKALNIQLGEDQLEALREKARALGISAEDLARAAVLDLVRQSDDAFEKAAARVLSKNAELYERLG